MRINTTYGTIISITTLILIALSSTLVTTLSMNTEGDIHSAILARSIEDTNATLIILPSIGGTTDIAPGTYNITAGNEVSLTAIPSEGFLFRYWIISGSKQGYGDASLLNANMTSANPLTITCLQGDTYRLQAVFTTNTDFTLEDLSKGITITKVKETVAFLVIIALSEAAILGILYIRRNRKTR